MADDGSGVHTRSSVCLGWMPECGARCAAIDHVQAPISARLEEINTEIAHDCRDLTNAKSSLTLARYLSLSLSLEFRLHSLSSSFLSTTSDGAPKTPPW